MFITTIIWNRTDQTERIVNDEMANQLLAKAEEMKLLGVTDGHVILTPATFSEQWVTPTFQVVRKWTTQSAADEWCEFARNLGAEHNVSVTLTIEEHTA